MRISLAVLALSCALAHAQVPSSTVAPRPGLAGNPFTNQVCNNTGGNIWFTSSAPWSIRDQGGGLVFGPIGLPVLQSLANGLCRVFQWDGRNNGGQVVPPGLYVWEVYWADALMNPQTPLRTCFEITDAFVSICANRTTVPVSCSAQLTFSSPLSAGLTYVAASALATAPPIVLTPCREVPLTFDGLFLLSLCSSGPVLVGYCGVLDSSGNAPAEVRWPSDTRLIGLGFETSFVTVNGGSIQSIAVPLRVTIGTPSPPCVFCR
jgi:hypothetical protein